MFPIGLPPVLPISATLVTPSSLRVALNALRDGLIDRFRPQSRKPPPRLYAFHYEHVLGTSLELQVVAVDMFSAQRAEAVTLREIDRLSSLLSTYDKNSEFSRWLQGATGSTPVSQELADVLDASELWRKKTNGAFNAAAVAVAANLPVTTGPLWSINHEQRTAKRLTQLPVSLDAIAKGFIIDRAAQCARETDGVTQVLVNIGGDIRHHGDRAVAVSVSDPFAPAENAAPIALVHIQNSALATSGGYRRKAVINGKQVSHILDARTGRSVEHIVSASVIAADCFTADALSTAFSVMTPEESLALADSLPGIGCLLVEQNGVTTSNSTWNKAAMQPSSHRAPERT